MGSSRQLNNGVRQWFGHLKRGEKLTSEVTTRFLNRIYNVLEDIDGDGCWIDKPQDNNGLGWRIVVDGQHSDADKTSPTPMPFEVIYVRSAWRLWLENAKVMIDNTVADPDDTATKDGMVSAAVISVGSSEYLEVYNTEVDSSGKAKYSYRITPSPQGGIVSVKLATITGPFTATQYLKGEMVFYTRADTEIVKCDNAKDGALSIQTNTESGYGYDYKKCAFVMRNGSTLTYVSTDSFAEWLFDKIGRAITEDTESEGEDYDKWRHWALHLSFDECKELVRECLYSHGWSFQPLCRVGYGGIEGGKAYAGVTQGWWQEITDEAIEIGTDFCPKSVADAINAIYDEIRDIYDAIMTDHAEDEPTAMGKLQGEMIETASLIETVDQKLAMLKARLDDSKSYIEADRVTLDGYKDRLATAQTAVTKLETDIKALEDKA